MSAEDGSVQTKIKPGAQWLLEAVLPPMVQATAQPWTAFLSELDGPAGRFFAGDPFKLAPLGVGTGTPLVAGAGRLRTTTGLAGVPPSAYARAACAIAGMPTGMPARYRRFWIRARLRFAIR